LLLFEKHGPGAPPEGILDEPMAIRRQPSNRSEKIAGPDLARMVGDPFDLPSSLTVYSPDLHAFDQSCQFHLPD